MGQGILMFGDYEIKKNKFYRHKRPIFLKDVDIEKVLVSDKISLGKKTAISSDSAPRKDENSYPQVFLKECKYVEKKVIRNINDNLINLSSSNESDEE